MIASMMRDPAKEFPSLYAPTEVKALRVWFCKYRTLRPVAELTNLQTLVIAGYPDTDFAPLGALTHLAYLSVLDFTRVSDLAPLAALQSLRTLRLHSPPSWDASGRVIEVDSLGPIAALPRLEHLELFGVRPSSGYLSELEAAPSLRSVRVSKYAEPEVARYQLATGVASDFAPAPPIPDWT
jgi:hypothetical protein